MRKTLIEVKVHLCFFLFQPVIFFLRLADVFVIGAFSESFKRICSYY